MVQRILVSFILLLTPIQVRSASLLKDSHTDTVSTSVDNSILLAAIKFGKETHTPIGIVLDTDKPTMLREEYRQFTVQDKPVPEFLNRLLAKSDYLWTFDGNVVVIKPTHLGNPVRSVLGTTFDRFGGMQTTMQGLGITLAAWINNRLNPESGGFITDIMASLDAEQFPQLNMRNASVEWILNSIVSLGSKGVWIFQLGKDFEHKKNITLHIYSYKDDAITLPTICNSISR